MDFKLMLIKATTLNATFVRLFEFFLMLSMSRVVVHVDVRGCCTLGGW